MTYPFILREEVKDFVYQFVTESETTYNDNANLLRHQYGTFKIEKPHRSRRGFSVPPCEVFYPNTKLLKITINVIFSK
jgi:hypothetical protein